MKTVTTFKHFWLQGNSHENLFKRLLSASPIDDKHSFKSQRFLRLSPLSFFISILTFLSPKACQCAREFRIFTRSVHFFFTRFCLSHSVLFFVPQSICEFCAIQFGLSFSKSIKKKNKQCRQSVSRTSIQFRANFAACSLLETWNQIWFDYEIVSGNSQPACPVIDSPEIFLWQKQILQKSINTRKSIAKRKKWKRKIEEKTEKTSWRLAKKPSKLSSVSFQIQNSRN
jgi:hypothetical protein